MESDVVMHLTQSHIVYGLTSELNPRGVFSHLLHQNVKCDFEKYSAYDPMNLVKIIKEIFISNLLVQPKGKNLILIYGSLINHQSIHKCLKIFLKNLELQSVFIMNESICALIPYALHTGLIISFDYDTLSVQPVYHGFPINDAFQFNGMGLEYLSKLAYELLRESIPQISDETTNKNLECEYKMMTMNGILPMLVEKCLNKPEDNQDLIFDFGENKQKLKVGNSLTLEHLLDMYFVSENLESSIIDLIQASIIKIPIDCKDEVIKNVIVSGSSWNLLDCGYLYEKFIEKLENIFKSKLSEIFQKYPLEIIRSTNSIQKMFSSWTGGLISYHSTCNKQDLNPITAEKLERYDDLVL